MKKKRRNIFRAIDIVRDSWCINFWRKKKSMSLPIPPFRIGKMINENGIKIIRNVRSERDNRRGWNSEWRPLKCTTKCYFWIISIVRPFPWWFPQSETKDTIDSFDVQLRDGRIEMIHLFDREFAQSCQFRLRTKQSSKEVKMLFFFFGSPSFKSQSNKRD